MEQMCQDPACPVKIGLSRYTIAPGIYLMLCKKCIKIRGYYATRERPRFLALQK